MAQLPTSLPARYALSDPIGEGGFGRVFRARDLQTDRDVAIKVPFARLDADVGRELALELQAAARVRHPGLVQILDVGEGRDRVPYMVMEYAEGGSARGLAGAPWAELRPLVADLLDALAHAHAHGLVHRDIKPANVLLSAGDGRVRAKLADFGLAKVLMGDREEYRSSRLVAGTMPYMPPEAFEGDVGAVHPAADLYAVGVLLFELLSTTGRPWTGGGYSLVASKLLNDPPALVVREDAGAPAGIEELVGRLLARMPSDRPALAADVAAELRRLDPEVPAGGAAEPGDGRGDAVSASVLVHREPRCVGREAELAALEEAAQATSEGPVVVSVVGPRGSGRTRLVQEFSRALEVAGRARTLRLLDAGTVEGAVRRGVRRLWGLGRLEGDALARRLEALPWATPRTQEWLEWGAGARPDDWLAVLVAVLRHEAARGLAVLHVEMAGPDMDAALARVLRAASVPPMRLLVLRVAGDADGERVVRCGPLSAEAGAALLADLGAEAVDGAAALPGQLVHRARLRATHALALPEPKRSRSATFLDRTDASATLTLDGAVSEDLPRERLRAFVGSDPERGALIGLFSLLPGPWQPGWLAEAWATRGGPELGPLLAAARFAGLVVPVDDGLALDAGLRDAALDGDAGPLRACAATALQGADRPPDVRLEAARLWVEQARPRQGFDLAVQLGVEAGDGDGVLARRAWELALAASEGLGAAERWHAVLGAAKTARNTGSLAQARELLDGAPTEAPPEDLARQRALLDGSLRSLANDGSAVEVLEGARDLCERGTAEDRATAWILLGAARHRAGDLDGAEADLRRAAELAPTSDLAVRAARRLAGVRWRRGERSDARRLLEDALATARTEGLPSAPVLARELGNLLVVLGEHAAAEGLLRESLAQLDAQGLVADVGTTRISLGELARMRGDAGTARREYKAAVSLSRAHRNDGDLLAALVNLVILELGEGREEEAARRLGAIDRVLDPDEPHRLRPWIEAGRLALAGRDGDAAQAAASARRLEALDDRLPADPDLLGLLLSAAEAAKGDEVALDVLELAAHIARALGEEDRVAELQRRLV